MSSPRETKEPELNERFFPQFHLWQAVAFITLAAILLAATSPYLRLVTPAQWTRVFGFSTWYLVGTCALLTFIPLWQRARSRVAPLRYRARLVQPAVGIARAVFYILGPLNGLLALWTMADIETHPMASAVYCASAGVMTAFPYALGPAHAVWIGDRGIAIGTRSFPWRQLRLIAVRSARSLDVTVTHHWRVTLRFADAKAAAFAYERLTSPEHAKK